MRRLTKIWVERSDGDWIGWAEGSSRLWQNGEGWLWSSEALLLLAAIVSWIRRRGTGLQRWSARGVARVCGWPHPCRPAHFRQWWMRLIMSPCRHSGVSWIVSTALRVGDVLVRLETGDEFLMITHLCEITFSQQEAKGVSGHQPKVGLFGLLGSSCRTLTGPGWLSSVGSFSVRRNDADYAKT